MSDNAVQLGTLLNVRLLQKRQRFVFITFTSLNYNFMKKRFFYWMFVAFAAMSVSLMSLTSCGNDDKDADPVAALKAQIVGEWEFKGSHYGSGDPVLEMYKREVYTFKADGKLDISDGLKVKQTKTWGVLIGDKKYIEIDGEKYALRTIDDNTLEFVYNESNGDFYRYIKVK